MDLLALLKDRVTPMLMTSETSDIDAKKYALEQFYPFLFTACAFTFSASCSACVY